MAIATTTPTQVVEAPKPELQREVHWYEDGRITHHLAGVFEGGGAKGMAYVGALDELARRGFWFRRVAGSSAGALTAALISSGATPVEIREGMDQMLGAVRGGRFSKLRRMVRLYWHGGMFSKHGLHVWLENWLAHKVRGLPMPEDDSKRKPKYTDFDNPVTFAELFAATGIELNVVAANLSIQRQMVFSVHDTPYCQVSDAVIASCSLPLAFHEADLVATDDLDQRKYVYTVVDGGVWSNFPIWLFTDKAFQRWSGRDEVPRAAEVVGFVLREPRPDEALTDARFHRYTGKRNWRGCIPFPAYEWRGSRAWLWAVLGFAFAPTKVMDALRFRNLSRPRWPKPKGPIKGFVSTVVEAWLRLGSAAPAGILLLAIAGYGAYWLYSLADSRVSAGRTTVAGVAWLAFDSVWILGGIMITIAALFFVNFLLGTAMRRIGYGLLRTFASAPGAPAWVDERDDIIVIDLPEGATTLNFDFNPDVLMESGRNAVVENVESLRRRLDAAPDAS